MKHNVHWDLTTIPTPLLLSEAARRQRALQPATPRKLRPCPHCDQNLGARELRAHVPECRRKHDVPRVGLKQARMPSALPIAPLGLGLKKPNAR
jgi:hypothetical protein